MLYLYPTGKMKVAIATLYCSSEEKFGCLPDNGEDLSF